MAVVVVVVAGCGRRSGKAHGRITLSRGIDFLILQVVDLEDRLFYFVLLRSFVKSLLGKRRRGLEHVGGKKTPSRPIKISQTILLKLTAMNFIVHISKKRRLTHFDNNIKKMMSSELGFDRFRNVFQRSNRNGVHTSLDCEDCAFIQFLRRRPSSPSSSSCGKY